MEPDNQLLRFDVTDSHYYCVTKCKPPLSLYKEDLKEDLYEVWSTYLEGDKVFNTVIYYEEGPIVSLLRPSKERSTCSMLAYCFAEMEKRGYRISLQKV